MNANDTLNLTNKIDLLELSREENKTIYQTYYKPIPQFVFDRWLALNPTYRIEFSLDTDCIQFLKEYFNNEVAELFKKIPMGMHKSDLWRLCKLYVFGGVYADVDLIPHLNMDTLDKTITFYSCLSKDDYSIFQAFIINFGPPKNKLILSCLMSFLLNSPYQYRNNPTVDIYNCIMNSLLQSDPVLNCIENNTKPPSRIIPDTIYNLNSVKINVNIGSSPTYIKIISLKYFPSDIPYTIQLNSNPYDDTFYFQIMQNALIVTRLDKQTGWAYPHSATISINSNEKMYFFKEDSLNTDFKSCFISYKGTKILDSRDPLYVDNNGW